MPLVTKSIRTTKSTEILIDNIITNNLSRTEHLNGILFDHLPIITIILDQYSTMTQMADHLSEIRKS